MRQWDTRFVSSKNTEKKRTVYHQLLLCPNSFCFINTFNFFPWCPNLNNIERVNWKFWSMLSWKLSPFIWSKHLFYSFNVSQTFQKKLTCISIIKIASASRKTLNANILIFFFLYFLMATFFFILN